MTSSRTTLMMPRPARLAGTCAVALLAVALSWLVAAGPARAAVASSAHGAIGPVVHLAFHEVIFPHSATGSVGARSNSILVDGRHAFLSDGRNGGTLIDERTGRQTQVSRAGCRPTALGGGWLAFECYTAIPSPTGAPLASIPASFEPMLYSLSSHTWSPVPLAATVAAACATRDFLSLQPCRFAGVGRKWIRIVVSVCQRDCGNDPVDYRFQNVAAPTAATDPTNATTIANLDSRALGQPVCAPLHVPLQTYRFPQASAPLDALTFEGRYAVSNSAATNGYTATYRERCGSRLHQLICRGCAVATNARAAVWNVGCLPRIPSSGPALGTPSRNVAGMRLRTGHRFRVRLPLLPTCFAPLPTQRPAVLEFVKLSSGRIYVGYGDQTGGLRVFAAPSPR